MILRVPHLNISKEPLHVLRSFTDNVKSSLDLTNEKGSVPVLLKE